jgi:zinc protease
MLSRARNALVAAALLPFAVVTAQAPPGGRTPPQPAGTGAHGRPGVPLDSTERAAAEDPLASAPLDAPLPLDPAVRAGRLPNGLRYYVRQNAKPEHRLELRLAVDAGSVLEDDDQRGLAHFVEHMAFNGTRRFAKQAIVSYLESVGMRFGADLNAYTGFDETVYTLTLPSDRPDALARGIEILGDWAHAITFDSLEVERERPVVIEEWRQGQGANARLRDAQMPVVFRGSRYADRLPIGDTSVVRAATPSDLRRFYTTWYRPGLMTVVAVGDVDPAGMEAEIRRRFGVLRDPATVRVRPPAPVPGHAGTLVSIVRDEEATSTSVSLLYKRDPAPLRSIGDYRRQLVEALYDQMLNARLYELSQRSDAPFLGAGSSKGRFVRAKDAYSLGAAVSDTGVMRGLRALLVEAARVERHGFLASELERARRDVLRNMEQAFAERDKTVSAAYAGEYVSAALDGEPYLSAADAWTLHQRFVPVIGLEEINALARDFISDSNRVVLVSAPANNAVVIPDSATLVAAFDDVRAAEVGPYVDDVDDAPLVATAPTAGRVVSASTDSVSGVTEWRLGNGVRVLVKPTVFKSDQVLLAATSPGGNSLAPDSTFLSASMGATAAALGGVGTFDQVQLEKALAGKAVSVSPSIGQLDEGISGSASPQDLETLFQLVHLYFTAPRRDPEAFQAFQARARSYLENRDRDPSSALADTLQVTLTSHNPRSRPMTPERFSELDLDSALRFYRDRFADAGDFTFVIVGNVDTTALRPMVESWLGSLPSAGRVERWRDVGVRAPDGVVTRAVHRGLEPKADTRLVFHGAAERTDLAERYAMAAMAQVLDMRLRDKLREELGGTYGASVSSSLSREPRPEFLVSIAFGSSPERVDELTRAVFAEVARMKTAEPLKEELAKVQEIMRRSLETGLEQNGYWLGQILSYDRQQLPLSEIASERRYVDALTPAMIRAAALRYLNERQYVLVSLLPETAK